MFGNIIREVWVQPHCRIAIPIFTLLGVWKAGATPSMTNIRNLWIEAKGITLVLVVSAEKKSGVCSEVFIQSPKIFSNDWHYFYNWVLFPVEFGKTVPELLTSGVIIWGVLVVRAHLIWRIRNPFHHVSKLYNLVRWSASHVSDWTFVVSETGYPWSQAPTWCVALESHDVLWEGLRFYLLIKPSFICWAWLVPKSKSCANRTLLVLYWVHLPLHFFCNCTFFEKVKKNTS